MKNLHATIESTIFYVRWVNQSLEKTTKRRKDELVVYSCGYSEDCSNQISHVMLNVKVFKSIFGVNIQSLTILPFF